MSMQNGWLIEPIKQIITHCFASKTMIRKNCCKLEVGFH